MPLDPNIILGVQPPAPPPSPLAMVEQVARLQDVREQAEQRRLAGEKARQDAADQAAMRNALAATGGDVDKALPQLYQINPRAAATLQENVGKARKETLDAAGKQLDTKIKTIQYGAGLFQDVHDQASYDLAMPWLRQLAPDQADAMGPVYDEGRVKALIAAGTDAKDRLELHKLALTHYANGDFNRSVGTALSAIKPTDPNAVTQWNKVLADAKEMGVPDVVLNAYGAASPGEDLTTRVQGAATQAMTPKERAEIADKAATLAQTVRHQTAEEATAAANTAVARGHLSVDQARLAMEQARPDLVQVMENGVAVWRPKTEAAGKPAAGGAASRPPTGEERKTLGFYTRAKEAVDTLTTPDLQGQTLEDRISPTATQWVSKIPIVGNYLQGEDAQRYTEAQRAFTDARLRSDKGRLAEWQYENDRKTYFAQPGDSAATIAQKKKARQTVLDSLASASGKAYEEHFGQPFTRDTGTGDGQHGAGTADIGGGFSYADYQRAQQGKK